jgi:hypothetical protein
MKRIIVIAGASLIFLWLFIPIPEVVSPDWAVLVTDAAGHPIPDAIVTVFSQDYTVETQDVEAAKVTGKDGLAHFDRRRIYVMGLMRLIGVIRNLDQGAHAGFGVHTHLHASKSGYGDPDALELFAQNERESRANGPAQQSSHVVLMQCQSGYSGFGCAFPDDPEKPVLPKKL